MKSKKKIIRRIFKKQVHFKTKKNDLDFCCLHKSFGGLFDLFIPTRCKSCGEQIKEPSISIAIVKEGINCVKVQIP